MKFFDPKRHLPLGWDWEDLRWGLGWGHVASLSSVLIFLNRYIDARGALYSYIQTLDGKLVKELVPGRIIAPFWELMAGMPYLGMWCFLLAMAWQALRHYQYHTRDSMPIYLMRRLPDKWELHRRCLTVPVLSAITNVLLFAAATMLCWVLYRTATPAGHLPV